MNLAELLHRHVLLRARERARQRDVERVGQDLLGLLGAGLREHHLVEGALHVEHHRVEVTLALDPGDRARGVVELLDAHRLREPAGRVDGEDDDLAHALGGPQRERRAGRRLADAAGAAAHDDAGAGVVEQGVDVERAGPVAGRRRRADPGRALGGAACGHGYAIPCSRRSPASS
ncbi:hypothetical protein D9M69_591060 [compost metagenome]